MTKIAAAASKLTGTKVMTASVSKIINQAANNRLGELPGVTSLTKQQAAQRKKNVTASLIAGSGLVRFSQEY